jgi:excinuclease ABC subunit C
MRGAQPSFVQRVKQALRRFNFSKHMSGRQVIQERLKTLPQLPGVYQMIDKQDNILYIGKAKNLRKRVSNYAKQDLPIRIARMVFSVCELKYIVTNSEAEALLMEAALIKKIKPKFNILLKDDKSFPYIKISDQAHPQISKFRGRVLSKKSKNDGDFFGPFASSNQVDVAITEIQKIFKIRTCSDAYFSIRKRPCLMYQIHKCSAPCVNKLTEEEYQNSATQAKKFLSGKSKELLEELNQEMIRYSKSLEYEKAASIRDRIKAVEYVRQKNSMSLTTITNADIIAIKSLNDITCVQVFIYRAGQNFGNNQYFPINAENMPLSEALMSFIGLFYQSKTSPEKIILNINLEDEKSVLEEALYQLHGVKTKICYPVNKEQKTLMEMVEQNALLALENKAIKLNSIQENLQNLQQLFGLSKTPERIEVYDNSHIMGQYAIGAMIVVGKGGFEKNQYRKFNIRTNTNAFGGDDYQMLREVLTRRLAKLTPENTPDLLIIDGGKGHLSVVEEVLSCMQLTLKYVCMSKGVLRNKGHETFHMPGKEPFSLENSDKTMQYLQMIRNQAHDFAIKSHRHRRNTATLKGKASTCS